MDRCNDPSYLHLKLTDKNSSYKNELDIKNDARMILKALATIHGAGVIHADISPANILRHKP
jgi:serine/threonine protein kinase